VERTTTLSPDLWDKGSQGGRCSAVGVIEAVFFIRLRLIQAKNRIPLVKEMPLVLFTRGPLRYLVDLSRANSKVNRPRNAIWHSYRGARADRF
jgi:hypothetical protein